MTPVNARSACAGFSLVEILIAIGLVTFALLVIFSLMPAGMATLHDANRQIIETEIYNAFGSDLASTPFRQLTNYVTGTNFPSYFDNEGNKVPSASNAVYIVRCGLDDSGFTNSRMNEELRRATVRIGFHYDPVSTNVGSPKVSKRVFLLVKSGT